MATKTRTRRRPQRTKMLALQDIFHGNRLIRENEVFWYRGDEAPAEHIAIPVNEDAPLGRRRREPTEELTTAPPWTTDGFKAAHQRGEADLSLDDLDAMLEGADDE